MSQGFTKNFAQLASVRFILGLVEGKKIKANVASTLLEVTVNN